MRRAKFSWIFEYKQITWSQPTIIPPDSQQKKRNGIFVEFAVPADDRANLKESAKRYKYLDLSREKKKQWDMKVTVIRICNWGTLFSHRLEELEIIGRLEIIQTTALLKSVRILRKVLKICGELLLLKVQWEIIS